jgi:hypothetical protein
MNDEQRTKSLMKYINDPKVSGIYNINEDETFVYFETEDVEHIMHLVMRGYDVVYKESKDCYLVRVLKPNWFSKPMKETMEGLQ